MIYLLSFDWDIVALIVTIGRKRSLNENSSGLMVVMVTAMELMTRTCSKGTASTRSVHAEATTPTTSSEATSTATTSTSAAASTTSSTA